ncbi:Uncharacterised protein [Serratia entomophila]|uniref:hypothetical protein n=1 Tax=Serratia entomophila TaxID=42906 RepID=UPI0021794C07|nr:hypothetical protein [Serratia entomophila]CAI1566582.1 Uncharacterised protein [Serratia entomophila]
MTISSLFLDTVLPAGTYKQLSDFEIPDTFSAQPGPITMLGAYNLKRSGNNIRANQADLAFPAYEIGSVIRQENSCLLGRDGYLDTKLNPAIPWSAAFLIKKPADTAQRWVFGDFLGANNTGIAIMYTDTIIRLFISVTNSSGTAVLADTTQNIPAGTAVGAGVGFSIQINPTGATLSVYNPGTDNISFSAAGGISTITAERTMLLGSKYDGMTASLSEVVYALIYAGPLSEAQHKSVPKYLLTL